MYVPNKLIIINQSINKIIDLSNTADKIFTYVNKLTGATTGATGTAKGTVDFAEAIACQDDIFTTVSAVE